MWQVKAVGNGGSVNMMVNEDVHFHRSATIMSTIIKVNAIVVLKTLTK